MWSSSSSSLWRWRTTTDGHPAGRGSYRMEPPGARGHSLRRYLVDGTGATRLPGTRRSSDARGARLSKHPTGTDGVCVRRRRRLRENRGSSSSYNSVTVCPRTDRITLRAINEIKPTAKIEFRDGRFLNRSVCRAVIPVLFCRIPSPLIGRHAFGACSPPPPSTRRRSGQIG